MKKGKSLMELAAEVQRQAETKRDFLVDTRHLRMDIPDEGGPVRLEFANEHTGITITAHDQIAGVTGVPIKYYRLMQEKAPILLAQNINHWFTNSPERRMVRTLDGNTRALLSDQFRPMDNMELATAVLPVLADLGVEVISADITEKNLYIKGVDQKVVRELPAGMRLGEGHNFLDVLCPAIVIRNSEVGHGRLAVEAGTYTKMCTNLAFFGERSMKKLHVGAKYGEFEQDQVFAMLTDDTRRLNDAALWSTVRDVVRAAFDEARFDALIGKLKATQANAITGDIPAVVEVVAERWGFTDGERKSVLDHLIRGGDLSQFGLHNAVTRAAEDLPDYDRASDFERLGGQIIELAANDWKRIAETEARRAA